MNPDDLIPPQDDLQKRTAALAEAQRLMEAGKIRTDAQLDAFMQSRGVTPKRPAAAPSDATTLRPLPTVHKAQAGNHSFGSDVLGFFQNMAKGVPLGTFADEAAALQVGLLTNPTNPLKDFERNRAHLDQPAKEYEERHPGLATGAQVLGGVGSSVGGVGVGQQLVNRLLSPAAAPVANALPPALTFGQRAANAAQNTAAAAVEAAISGAGEARGSLRPRIAGAQQAGRVGGILGGTIGAAGTVGGTLRASRAGRTAENLAPRPAGAASNRVGRMIRSAGVRTHDELADADILVAMERTPLTPEEAVARGLAPDAAAQGLTLEELGRRAAARPNATLYDLLGTPGVRMARGARTHPEGGAIIDPVLEARREARPGQVRAATEQGFGANRENAVMAARRFADEQRERARPLYDEAYAFGVIDDVSVRQQLTQLRDADPGLFETIFRNADVTARLDPEDGRPLINPFRNADTPNAPAPTPAPQGARTAGGRLRDFAQVGDDDLLAEYRHQYQRSQDTTSPHAAHRAQQTASVMGRIEQEMARRGVAPDDFRSRLTAPQQGAANPPSVMPAEEVPGNIDVRTLDYLKKGLDAVIEKRGADGAPVLTRHQARALRTRLNRILDRADEVIVTPDGRHVYRDARQTWGGDMEARNAFDAGREFTRTPADEVEADFPDLAAPAQEQFRRGALANVTEVAEKKHDGIDLTVMFRTPDMQRKLGVVIQDPPALQRLQETIDELYQQRTNDLTIGSGSQTVDKAQDAMDIGALGQAVEAGTSPSGFVNWLAQSAAGQRAAGRAEDRVRGVANTIVGRGDAFAQTQRRLQETIEREFARRARSGSLTRGVGRVTGTQTGG